jgi:hypothetical protein
MGVTAHAQTLFTGSGCAGNTFAFCASWTMTFVDATHFSLFLTNISQNAPSNNPLSVFTQIGIGNVAIADPTTMGAVAGWQYDANINGFSGFGLLENQFGASTSNGINDGITVGNSRTFVFTAPTSLTFAQASTSFSGAQIAIHDQGAPQNCTSSKGVLVGATSGQNLYSGQCTPTTTTPEPSTYALVATGMVGIFGFARRRRTA